MEIMTNNKPTLFLSYNQKDAPIANIIENKLREVTNDGIEISRYTQVPYRSSFKTFMHSIQEHDFVLCIVSGNYLKSQACMYEVGEIVKDPSFQKKLLFVVLCEKDIKYYSNMKNDFEAANIYGSLNNRVKYIEFWKNKYFEAKQEIKRIGSFEASRLPAGDLYEIGKIFKNDIGVFLDYLYQSNGKNFEELYSSDFIDIAKLINPKWESKLFGNSNSFSQILDIAIHEIYKITGTDYNQIALNIALSSYEKGLVVFADNIPHHKQNYDLVNMQGIMGKVFSVGHILNINNTNTDNDYFCAVEETRSELVVPIIYLGNPMGVINSESEEINHYSYDIVQRIVALADEMAIALHRIGYNSNLSRCAIPRVHV